MGRFALALAALLATTVPSAEALPALDVHRALPRDPMIALAFRSERLDLDVARLATLWSGIAPDVALGFDDLLGAELAGMLGPQFAASIDLPPLEAALEELEQAGTTIPDVLLSRSGVIAGVREPDSFFAALERATRRAGWGFAADETSATLTLGPEPAPRLHVRMRGDRLAAAFSKSWVEQALEPRKAAPRLDQGSDFAAVFGHLEPRPDELLYVNLPALRRWIVESPLAMSVLRATDDTGELLAAVVDEQAMTMGVGATTVRDGRGVRTSSYGPDWMAGPLRTGGMLAAITLPGMMTQVETSRTHRSIDDLHRIAVACDEFSADSDGYPGPTEGWVPVDRIAMFLEPIYIGELPRADAWSNPILYWSDGTSYRVISTGGDGIIDRDWRESDETLASSSHDGDIVFGNGRLLVVPDRLVSE